MNGLNCGDDGVRVDWSDLLVTLENLGLTDKKKVEVPMEFENMNTLGVLTQVSNSLRIHADIIGDELVYLKDSLSNMSQQTHSIESELADIRQTIHNIGEFISERDTSNRSKIDPSKCLHKNKTSAKNGNIETITCSDCDLLLSYQNV